MSVTEEPLAVEFAPLREEDLGAIMRIEHEAYPEPWTQGMFRDEIRNARSHFFVMRHAGRIVGYGGFWLVLDEAHITSVAVDREFRSRGLGRRLVVHLLEAALEAGATMATLEVRESNAHARALYESLGFEISGRRKGYYPSNNEDAVVMLRELR